MLAGKVAGQMVAEVISVGTELLLGQIIDTNAAYLSQQLSHLGISVYHRATVGDNFERAVATARQAHSRADFIFLIGGLGPTMDDLTREIIAEVMEAPLERDESAAKHLQELFASRGYKMVESNFRQAMVPTGGRALPNANGTAPGILVEKSGKAMIALPGPPNEFIPMFETQVLPYLEMRVEGQRQVIRSRTLRIMGIGESSLEDMVKDLMQDANPSVAPYAKVGEVHLRVTAKAGNEAEADSLIAERANLLYECLGNHIYGENETTLEEAVVHLLKEKRQTVATAESCTGGLLSGRITNVPGSSEVFGIGLVTYSNDAKINLLQIPRAVIGGVGAVSPEVAQGMAERVRELARADFGIGITGIAGPGGGSAEKPVGLVYIGLASDGEVIFTKNLYGGVRADIRHRATQTALEMLRQKLLTL
ncbi:MAG: competence/damage-inducible protein A [Armatimonadaceae bacterium]